MRPNDTIVTSVTAVTKFYILQEEIKEPRNGFDARKLKGRENLRE